eukprot:m51a1_g1830 hypothetical protein (85) ;mRNA; r:535313-535762
MDKQARDLNKLSAVHENSAEIKTGSLEFLDAAAKTGEAQARVTLREEDIAVLVSEFEIERGPAERALQSANGDLAAAISALVRN